MYHFERVEALHCFHGDNEPFQSDRSQECHCISKSQPPDATIRTAFIPMHVLPYLAEMHYQATQQIVD